MARMPQTGSTQHDPTPETRRHLLRFYLVMGLVAIAWFLFLRLYSGFTGFTTTSTALLGVGVALSVFGAAGCSRRMIHNARRWENVPAATLFLVLLSVALIVVPAPLAIFTRAMAAEPIGPHGIGAVYGSWWFCGMVAFQVVATRWYAILPLFAFTYGASKWAAG